ncbi:CC191 protein, partial [Amia calva]|nr:CC191 protein [Amia calva]
MNNDDIDHWMKRVEAASEFAVSEVFSLKKPSARSKVKGPAMALESVDQLYDHDEAYSEAQALLSDWMSTKLRLELEAGEDDSPLGDCDADSPQTQPLTPQAPAFLQIHNFDDLYAHLEQEAESTAVHSFLQELMEKEVVDSGIVEDLRMDTERDRRRQKDPRVTMEIRHQQVRESRARREQQREQQRRELAVRREAEAEARRRVQEQERVRRLQERKQEELLQREVVQLRKEMGEKRSIAQLARQMERERLDRKRSAGRTTQDLPTPLPLSPQAAQMQPEQPDAERLRRRQEAEARAHMLNLRCLQHHFSGWYSVVLEGRVRLGKAAALCDWRSQLRAWRAWRALVWARRVEREAQSTEEELRRHNRQAWRVAVESDGRRVLRQCLGAWCSWSRAQREGRELRAQQDETRRKMAALLAAASSGRLADHATTDPPEQSQSPTQPRAMQPAVECADSDLGRTPSAPVPGSAGSQWVSEPREAWQVTRRHAALSAKELSRAGEQPDSSQQGRGSGRGRLVLGGRFENRHAFQQELLEQQRRQLREQEETIQELQENQRLMMLRQEAERVAMATRKAQPAPQSRAAAAATTPPQGSSAVGKQISCSTLPASRGVQGPSAPHHPTVRGQTVLLSVSTALIPQSCVPLSASAPSDCLRLWRFSVGVPASDMPFSQTSSFIFCKDDKQKIYIFFMSI